MNYPSVPSSGICASLRQARGYQSEYFYRVKGRGIKTLSAAGGPVDLRWIKRSDPLTFHNHKHTDIPSMIPNDQFRQRLAELFRSQHLATLSTHNDGQPYASLVAFHASEDLKRIYFVTPTTTRKFANLTADNRVAVMVNSSTNQASDFHKAISVTAVGRAEVVTGSDRDSILVRYLTKHSHLEEFVRSPSCALVEVAVNSYYMVKNFQNVMELHLEP